ncbi:DUF4097 family beta strand repeat-containing protein [Lactobacillus helveticus]|jgi:DUF4097 and DUF4098 domain-containing protein YvlB|uniref:DUF4097 domain-containing protein n=4 Tax=Lactobacillus helveticus TaxID=1587 RepID=A0A0D5MJ69_LACHE|nr:DUF4097 family beta strand repeat-containing protein [Lactobacillus helveticus]EGF38174.1 hypothetical protein AAULH_06346 [Lactobacillus helveticus MTCC 5463]ABX27168.1 hypothetical protein lhv_1113 [Lactobacillus helveticus DPC 4571]ADX70297.1 Putative uncharacterized protein [Lactobacillus helveticus H10]AJY61539.1 hypothetical protein HUO_06660 [Lactobacillus helveticus]AKG66771.1 hypothetical protein TU99_05610 [Lactobacillus helveticus]
MFFNKNDKIEKVDKILTNEAFEELQVDFADINLAIESGDHFEVHYHGTEDKQPVVTQNEQQLRLKQPETDRKNGRFWQKGLFKIEVVTSSDVGKVKITIPKDHHLREAYIGLASGDTKMRDINIDELEFGSASGDLKIDKLNVNKLSLSIVSGDAKLDQVKIDSGNADLTSGNFILKNSQIMKILAVTTVSGDNLIENVEVDQCDLTTLSGDNTIFGGNATHAQIGKETNGSHLKMSAVSGDNTVK